MCLLFLSSTVAVYNHLSLSCVLFACVISCWLTRYCIKRYCILNDIVLHDIVFVLHDITFTISLYERKMTRDIRLLSLLCPQPCPFLSLSHIIISCSLWLCYATCYTISYYTISCKTISYTLKLCLRKIKDIEEGRLMTDL
jgi:hypothetical protein